MRHPDALEELLDQPGLADPSPSPDQERPSRPVPSGSDHVQLPVEQPQLLVTADEDRHTTSRLVSLMIGSFRIVSWSPRPSIIRSAQPGAGWPVRAAAADPLLRCGDA